MAEGLFPTVDLRVLQWPSVRLGPERLHGSCDVTLSDIIKRLQLDPMYPRDEIVRDLTNLIGSSLGQVPPIGHAFQEHDQFTEPYRPKTYG